MATYNGAAYLEEQLQSLVRQTRLPDELVVTDDSSSDDTVRLLERFAERMPFPVRIHINSSNLGYSRNFEKAATLADGDIIFFCDQDDRWHPDKIAQSLAAFERSAHTMVVLVDTWLCDADLAPTSATLFRNIRKLGQDESFYVMGAVSAHRRNWRDVMFPIPEGCSHDLWLNHFATVAGLTTIIERPLLDYRRHGSNASQTTLYNEGGAQLADLWRGHGMADARAGWASLANLHCLAAERVESAAINGLLDQEVGTEGSKRLMWWHDAYRARIEAVSKNRVRRLPSLATMAVRGQYRPFLGWKSLAKDLLRPKPIGTLAEPGFG